MARTTERRQLHGKRHRKKIQTSELRSNKEAIPDKSANKSSHQHKNQYQKDGGNSIISLLPRAHIRHRSISSNEQ